MTFALHYTGCHLHPTLS